MCLEQLTPIYNVKEGYKVFTGKEVLLGLFRVCYRFKKRRWICDENTGLIKTECGLFTYPTGFHVFLSKKFALKYTCSTDSCHRVLIKDIVACGLQEMRSKDSATVVCKQIYIMEEVTE